MEKMAVKLSSNLGIDLSNESDKENKGNRNLEKFNFHPNNQIIDSENDSSDASDSSDEDPLLIDSKHSFDLPGSDIEKYSSDSTVDDDFIQNNCSSQINQNLSLSPTKLNENSEQSNNRVDTNFIQSENISSNLNNIPNTLNFENNDDGDISFNTNYDLQKKFELNVSNNQKNGSIAEFNNFNELFSLIDQKYLDNNVATNCFNANFSSIQKDNEINNAACNRQDFTEEYDLNRKLLKKYETLSQEFVNVKSNLTEKNNNLEAENQILKLNKEELSNLLVESKCQNKKLEDELNRTKKEKEKNQYANDELKIVNDQLNNELVRLNSTTQFVGNENLFLQQIETLKSEYEQKIEHLQDKLKEQDIKILRLENCDVPKIPILKNVCIQTEQCCEQIEKQLCETIVKYKHKQDELNQISKHTDSLEKENVQLRQVICEYEKNKFDNNGKDQIIKKINEEIQQYETQKLEFIQQIDQLKIVISEYEKNNLVESDEKDEFIVKLNERYENQKLEFENLLKSSNEKLKNKCKDFETLLGQKSYIIQLKEEEINELKNEKAKYIEEINQLNELLIFKEKEKSNENINQNNELNYKTILDTLKVLTNSDSYKKVLETCEKMLFVIDKQDKKIKQFEKNYLPKQSFTEKFTELYVTFNEELMTFKQKENDYLEKINHYKHFIDSKQNENQFCNKLKLEENAKNEEYRKLQKEFEELSNEHNVVKKNTEQEWKDNLSCITKLYKRNKKLTKEKLELEQKLHELLNFKVKNNEDILVQQNFNTNLQREENEKKSSKNILPNKMIDEDTKLNENENKKQLPKIWGPSLKDEKNVIKKSLVTTPKNVSTKFPITSTSQKNAPTKVLQKINSKVSSTVQSAPKVLASQKRTDQIKKKSLKGG